MGIWKDKGTGSGHVTLIREVEMRAGETAIEGGGGVPGEDKAHCPPVGAGQYAPCHSTHFY